MITKGFRNFNLLYKVILERLVSTEAVLRYIARRSTVKAAATTMPLYNGIKSDACGGALSASGTLPGLRNK